MTRARICGRSLEGGPGTCRHWWDNCPKGVAHCFMRFIREATGQPHGGSVDLATAQEWQAARDAAAHPPPPTPAPQMTLDLFDGRT